MAGYHKGNKFKMICGGKKIKKGICGGNVVYSGASPVTYNVDTDTVYIEEVDSGISCLTPTSFTPTKEGYTFLGWKEDTTADSSVLTDKVMGDEPVTLYAVFEQTINLYTTSNGSKKTNSGKKYYNNGNVSNPKFTVANPTRSGWTFKGWSTGASSTTVSYTTISNLTLTANTNLYAVWNVADKTVSTSASCSTGSVFMEGTQTRTTLLSSVDTSKYSSVVFNFSRIESETSYRATQLDIYITDGTNKTRIGYASCDWSSVQANNKVVTYSPTLSFSSSSGTKNVSIQTSVTVYGQTGSANTQGEIYVLATSYTLKGRTVVY